MHQSLRKRKSGEKNSLRGAGGEVRGMERDDLEYQMKRMLHDRFLWRQWIVPTILSLAALGIAIAALVTR